MNTAGLIVSAALLYLYTKQSSKTADIKAPEFISPDNFGIDYNDTTLPDTIQGVKPTMRIVSIGKDSVKARVYLYIPSPKNAKQFTYINDIKINASLFGKYFSFWNKVTTEEYRGGSHWYHTDYEVWYESPMQFRYSPFGYMFGEGEVTGLTSEQIQQVRDAVGVKETQDFARVDVQISWSWERNGNKNEGSRWNKGIIQKIPCMLVKD